MLKINTFPLKNAATANYSIECTFHEISEATLTQNSHDLNTCFHTSNKVLHILNLISKWSKICGPTYTPPTHSTKSNGELIVKQSCTQSLPQELYVANAEQTQE
jgi:hypothetical protein